MRYRPLHQLNQIHDATGEELWWSFDSLQELKRASRSQRESSEAPEQQEMQREAEFRRIRNVKALDKRKKKSLQMGIMEKIVILRCPRKTCRAAFLDFNRLFALNCGNRDRRAHFCA